MKNVILWITSWIINGVIDLFHRLKLNFYLKIKRRIKNLHNNTVLNKIVDISKISIWKYTYGPINVQLWCYKNSYIVIWSFCAIAENVEFICWADHTTTYLSQLWFDWIYDCYFREKLLLKDYKPYKIDKISEIKKSIINNHNKLKSKWPIIIDDDVWIWTWAKIMSWVHIWQWAVVAAWAVVTKDIPPYAIAWWVPAKVLWYRFSNEIIKKLKNIDFSNTPIEKFLEIRPETIKEDFDIDYILEKIKW